MITNAFPKEINKHVLLSILNYNKYKFKLTLKKKLFKQKICLFTKTTKLKKRNKLTYIYTQL